MQQLEQTAGMATAMATAINGTERKRVEAVMETLANLHSQGESLAEVAHDARNMVTALGLYCDLLEEPGVLAAPFAHYGNELRLVAAASRRLVEKLVALDSHAGADAFPAGGLPAPSPNRNFDEGHERSLALSPDPRSYWNPERSLERRARWDLMPSDPVDNLAAELLANRNLLTALAGPAIALTLDAASGALPVRITAEDLTRVLVNLIKNAAEAMPTGGRIQIGLRECPATAGAGPWLALAIEDNGPGIPEQSLDRIFESGYTTRATGSADIGGWAVAHRGLGLSITRSIVEAAGGRITAANRAQGGARFEIELPVEMRQAPGF